MMRKFLRDCSCSAGLKSRSAEAFHMFRRNCGTYRYSDDEVTSCASDGLMLRPSMATIVGTRQVCFCAISVAKACTFFISRGDDHPGFEPLATIDFGKFHRCSRVVWPAVMASSAVIE